MLAFPPPLTVRGFLEQHWQKRPLFMAGALPRMTPVIGADELAWLATQPDVESRLVLTEKSAQRDRYRVEHGPFSERRLERLPGENWTLLVHDVDKHLPAFRAYYGAVSFLPDWRIDDLMISVAAPGGSVGPHRDHYDVFLCQASGTREWRVAETKDAVPARRRSALALLEPFECPAPLVARPSDVLYLPQAVPHWGIAADHCITYSLGMRAATRNELVAAMRRSSKGGAGRRPSGRGGKDRFYADPDLRPDEARPGRIGPQAIARAARMLAPEAVDGILLACAFGTAVTTPKAWLAPEMPDELEIEGLVAQLAGPRSVRLHGMARLAWYDPIEGGEATPLAFVNGRTRAVSASMLAEFRRLCACRRIQGARWARLSASVAGRDFLRWLVGSGAFDLAAFWNVKCEGKSCR